MGEQFRLKVTFWGVRGSIPTPAPENLRFGGNTTCLEIGLPDGDVVVVDGGTGARKLGLSLMERARGKSLALHFLLTHFHWDHIQGIPFFAPLYVPTNRITFHAGKTPEVVQETLEGQMTSPYFPVQFELLAAKREFAQIGETPLECGALKVKAFPLNHPQGANGFRLEANGAVIVHASDHEHGDGRLDAKVLEYAQGADVLIYDAQFTPEEYRTKKGWGHSTWLEATKVARQAGAGQLVLFHHDPSHNDDFLRGVLRQAQAEFKNTQVAQEGWSIVL